MLTGVNPNTMNNLLLGAGVFLKNFTFDDATDADKLRALVLAALQNDAHILGATAEGSQFICQPQLHAIGANGVRQPYVGGVLCDGWQVRLIGTLLEVTPDNLSLLLAMGTAVHQGDVTTVTVRSQPCAEDHLHNLCWIGRHGSGYLLIELLGAMNMTGVTLHMRDKAEGTMPFDMHAHALTPQDQDAAPCRMVFFHGGDAHEAE